MQNSEKIKVAFDINVIGHYRVPLFRELSKHLDLLVIASNNKNVDGLKDVDENLPFRTRRLTEIPETSFIPSNTLYHPEIFNALREHGTEVLISFSSSFDRMLNNKKALGEIRSRGIKTIWMGCDGYMARNPLLSLVLELINPRLTVITLRNIMAMRKVDHFLPYSTYTAKYLRLARFVPSSKITVAHNAIDTKELNAVYNSIKGTGEKRDHTRIVFTGRLSVRKKVDVLIKAFSKILDIFPDAKLDIIGEGSEEMKLKKLATDLGVETNVNFIGGIYDDLELAPHLCKASLFVMPGIGGLGFNTAMACGLPIIYTHADGTEEDIIKDGYNGWYFDGSEGDLKDKLEKALKNPEEMKRMGSISEKIITEKYNLDNMVKTYIDSIHKITGK